MKYKYMWLSQLWLMTGVISEQYVFGFLMVVLMFVLSTTDREK